MCYWLKRTELTCVEADSLQTGIVVSAVLSGIT